MILLSDSKFSQKLPKINYDKLISFLEKDFDWSKIEKIEIKETIIKFQQFLMSLKKEIN